MGNEIKIANCGCGGKAMLYVSPITTRCLLQCESCKIETAFFNTEIEAVEAWNKAMGAKDINVPNKCVTDINVGNKERKTKTIVHCWKLIEYLCGNCKKKVLSNANYCSHCGAKLDWGDNE